MSWVSRFFAVPKVVDRVNSALPVPPPRKPPAEPARAIAEASALRAMRISGIVRLDDVAVTYFEAIREKGFVSFKDLIRDGEILTTEQKRELGIKSRAKVGDRFASMLNRAGLDDPMEAAGIVCAVLNQQRQSLQDLHRDPDMFGEETQLQFMASNMAAGPCPHAESLANSLVGPASAGLLPFEDCVHPSQCGCRYLPKR